jgi:predicted nucleic-acid-binding protein
MHLYNEIDSIKKTLTENKARQPEKVQKKIDLVLEKISSYSKVKINKDMLLEIVKIQSLSEELEQG